MRKTVMTMVALVGVLAGLGPAVPVSAGPPEFTVELSIDPTSGPAGSTVMVTGTCLFGDVPGDGFGIIMHVTPGQGLPPTAKIFHFPVAADGSVSGTLTVPAEWPAANYELTADCALSDMVAGQFAEATFVVTIGGTVATELPTTTTDPTTGAATDPGRRAGPRYTG